MPEAAGSSTALPAQGVPTPEEVRHKLDGVYANAYWIVTRGRRVGIFTSWFVLLFPFLLSISPDMIQARN
jgi:hypothetical protein